MIADDYKFNFREPETFSYDDVSIVDSNSS